ncbi:MAG: DUF4349 domain-containing protein [Bacillota bacterium]|nr:DUF4349 domain-containing protein [Bacillota bacterium]
MNCRACKEKISLYIDNELTDKEVAEFEEHLRVCDNCRVEFENTRYIIETVNNMPLEKLPEGYCEKLHDKLTEKKSKNKWNWKRITAIAATFVVLIGATYVFSNLGLGGGKTSNDMGFMEEAAEEPAFPAEAPSIEQETAFEEAEYDDALREEMGFSGVSDSEKNVGITSENTSYRDRELKIIKTGSLEVETSEYDKFVDNIESIVRDNNGYIENMETYTNNYYYDSSNNKVKLRTGRFTIRIPNEAFQSVFDYLKGEGELIQESINENDVTRQYYEIDNKVKNLEVQEERLRELMGQAENVTEIMEIEKELTRIRSEIDNLKMNLSDIDNRASMSTIHLGLREIENKGRIQPVDENIWSEAKESFTRSINRMINFMENSFIALIGFIPILVVTLVALYVIWIIVKKVHKKKS